MRACAAATEHAPCRHGATRVAFPCNCRYLLPPPPRPRKTTLAQVDPPNSARRSAIVNHPTDFFAGFSFPSGVHLSANNGDWEMIRPMMFMDKTRRFDFSTNFCCSPPFFPFLLRPLDNDVEKCSELLESVKEVGL